MHNHKVLSFHIYHPLIYFDDVILFRQLLHSWQFAEVHPSDDVLPFAFLKSLRKEIASEDHRSKNKIDIKIQNQKVTEKSLFTESVIFAMIFVCWEVWYQSCVQIAVRKKEFQLWMIFEYTDTQLLTWKKTRLHNRQKESTKKRDYLLLLLSFYSQFSILSQDGRHLHFNLSVWLLFFIASFTHQ